MPRGSTSVAWFEEIFGFEESTSFSGNQAKFAMDGYELVCESSPTPRQYVGPWETPSLQELRVRLAEILPAAAEGQEGLKFEHVATPVGVGPLILDPDNAGAVFQAASQFNALEMVGPGVSPRQGVAIYSQDPTQGPKCAMACPAGTVFRNYLVDCGGSAPGQGGDKQIDCLSDLGEVVGNENGRFWKMQSAPRAATEARWLARRSCVSQPCLTNHWRRQA